MVKRNFLFILSLLLGMAACQPNNVVVDRFIPIPDRNWDVDFQPEMEIHVPDNTVPYTIYVNLRHTHQYRYSNIFILLHQNSIVSKLPEKENKALMNTQTGLDSAAISTDSLAQALALQFKKHPPVKKRIEMQLAAPDGRWLGKQSGNLYTMQKLAIKDYYFPDTGKFLLRLEQNMRDNPLKYVVEAGLRIDLQTGK